MDILDPFFLVDTEDKIYVFLDHREFGLLKEKNKNPNLEVVLLDPFFKETEQIR